MAFRPIIFIFTFVLSIPSYGENCAEIVREAVQQKLRESKKSTIPKTDQEKLEFLKEFYPQMHSLARQLAKDGSEITADDLMSTGNLAILESLEKFDPKMGPTLGQYAFTKARQAMIIEKRRTSILPPYELSKVTRLLKAETKLRKTLVRQPTEEEVAAELKTSLDQIRKTRLDAIANLTYKLENQLLESDDDGAKVMLKDLIPDLKKNQLEELIEKEQEHLLSPKATPPKVSVPATAMIGEIKLSDPLKTLLVEEGKNLYGRKFSAFVRGTFLLESDEIIAKQLELPDAVSAQNMRNGAVVDLRKAIGQRQPKLLPEFDDFVKSRMKSRETTSISQEVKTPIAEALRNATGFKKWTPQFESSLTNAISQINDDYLEVVKRTLIGHESDDAVALSLGHDGIDKVKWLRLNSIRRIRNYFKNRPPEEAAELEDFIKQSQKLGNRKVGRKPKSAK
jgi:RNA polymerase sigma factor for flagellar operon FliA